MHLALRNAEVTAHFLCVEIAHRKKAIYERDIRPDQIQSLAAIRLAQTVYKQVFALQGAKDREVQLSFDWLRKRDQERVGKIHHVGARFGLEPVDQVVEFLSLKAVFTFQHRDS